VFSWALSRAPTADFPPSLLICGCVPKPHSPYSGACSHPFSPFTPCTVCACRVAVRVRARVDGHQLESASVGLFVEKFFTFFLLNASFVPIGLYVTMKLARSFQKVFLEADKCVGSCGCALVFACPHASLHAYAGVGC
jgi:hypothetical protein